VEQQTMFLARNSHKDTAEWSGAEQEYGKPIHVQTDFQNTNPNEIHILATSQIATHLFSRATVITHSIFSCFAHQWTPKHSASSTEATLTSNLDNHSKTCVLPSSLLPKSYYQHFESFSSIPSNLKQYLTQMHCSFRSAIL